jgi:TolA-binding protein
MTIGGMMVTATVALAQDMPFAPPAPPARPRAMAAPAPMAPQTPMAMPAPAAAPAPQAMPTPRMLPMPAIPPMPPMAIEPEAAMLMAQDALDAAAPVLANLDVQMADVKAQLDNMKFDFQFPDVQFQIQDEINAKIEGKMAATNAKIAEASARAMADKFRFDGMRAPMAMQQKIYSGPRGSDDSMYQNGLNAINNHQYEQALSEFNNVISRAGVRAEGAYYWKAYVLNKQGHSAEAQAAIDVLRKNYPNSHWLDDAKVLELEVKQSKGPVSPDAETDDDLKMLALTGLMQSDPEKALPQVEKILKGSHSPNLKRQALFVIAQNNTPKAQQMLEQIARGGNPDLQVRAIQFMSQRRNPDTPKILLEIYTSTTDPAVKRAVLETFSNNRDKERIVEILKNERDGNLRSTAINRLGDVDGQPELWQIYQTETTTEGKVAVLNAMRRNGNLDKLTEVAKTDKEPKVRQTAIEIIADQDGGNSQGALVALYSSEQDEKVKRTIIDHLSGGRRNGNCKPLVDVAKSEKDMKLKLQIVQRLSNMTTSCPAATEYLTELLNR